MPIGINTLDPDLKSIMMRGALGGDSFYVAETGGNTRDFLRDERKIDPFHLHETLADAYRNTVTGRNDVIYIRLPENRDL